MKNLRIPLMLTLLLILPIIQVAKAEPPNSAQFEDSFKMGNDTFAIKAVKSFVSLYNNKGEKIDFSVFKNSKFVHSKTANGGTLIGCRYAFGPPDSPKDRNPIQRLSVSGKDIGWWINTGAHCGNRSTRLYAAVVAPSDSENAYTVKEYQSNYLGVLAQRDERTKGVGVWSMKYYDDCGAFTIQYPVFENLLGEVALPETEFQWPKNSDFGPTNENGEKSIYPSTFVSRFIAGMANKNMALLTASSQIFDENAKSNLPEWCIPKFLPKTKGDLQKAIDAYRVLDQQGLLSVGF